MHELRALCPPGAAQPLPALLLEDVTGRLNTEDDMTFCEVRLRSCHADEAAARLEELANHPPVRGWPSDTQLRGLHSATPAPLTFHRSFSDSLKSAASWRFAVLLDVCGVTIVDWLPKECWKQVPLAERPRDAGVTAPGASSLSERPFLRTGEDF